MAIISWIILGLIAGAIAKAIMKGGNEPQGWIATIILGIVGALVGGWIASAIFKIRVNDSFFSWQTWLFGVIGSCIVLWIYGALTRNRN